MYSAQVKLTNRRTFIKWAILVSSHQVAPLLIVCFFSILQFDCCVVCIHVLLVSSAWYTNNKFKTISESVTAKNAPAKLYMYNVISLTSRRTRNGGVLTNVDTTVNDVRVYVRETMDEEDF